MKVCIKCDRKARSRGLCDSHYRKEMDSLRGIVRRAKTDGLSVADRLEFYSERVTESGCQIWTGAISHGYGELNVSGKPMLAHRLSWELVNGPIPNGLLLCHTCDVPSCINPNHLFLGTDAMNSQDKVNKGRHAKGSKAGGAKLKEDQVAAILLDRRRQKNIATYYGVDPSLISKIKNTVVWRHVSPNKVAP